MAWNYDESPPRSHAPSARSRNQMIRARFSWNDEAFRSEGQKWHIDGIMRRD
jgi:hypothetical protein